MRAQGTSGARPPEPPDQELWRRSQAIDAAPDEAEHLLDLAAFADDRLDEDEAACIAALIARDVDAADDVAAARLLADFAMAAADPGVVTRATALVGEGQAEAVLIAFPVRQPAPRPWFSAATWGSLAAAIALAGWLGFDLGSGMSSIGRSGEDVSANELLDSAPLLLRDFTDNSQI
jgi:hypothetical protein